MKRVISASAIISVSAVLLASPTAFAQDKPVVQIRDGLWEFSTKALVNDKEETASRQICIRPGDVEKILQNLPDNQWQCQLNQRYEKLSETSERRVIECTSSLMEVHIDSQTHYQGNSAFTNEDKVRIDIKGMAAQTVTAKTSAKRIGECTEADQAQEPVTQ